MFPTSGVNWMALLRDRTDSDGDDVVVERDDAVSDERDERVIERTGPSPGLIRALFTLLGVAAAGLLLWVAQLFDLGATDEFWAAMGIVACAGIALGLSQLFGGWTKWGWPTISPMVLLLGFLPTLVVGGAILLARQPDGGWQQSRFDGWASDLGVTGFVDAMVPFLPVIALVIGLVFSFSFDTTGPRTHVIDRERTAAIPDEDVHDYRGDDTDVTTDDTEVVTADREPSVAESLRERDTTAEPAGTTRIEQPTDRP
jgi:hypothetical protein